MTDSEDILEESRETLDYLHENNSEKDSGGLPTAAYKVTAEREHLDSDIEVIKKNRPQHHKEDIDQVDELVRRKDVKALIQAKYVDPLEEEIERIKDGVHDLENPELVIQHHEMQLENFEELLEELEQ